MPIKLYTPCDYDPIWYTAGDGLSESELEAVASGVIEECDISKNRRLSYAEFEHVVSRAPDFVNLFHITA